MRRLLALTAVGLLASPVPAVACSWPSNAVEMIKQDALHLDGSFELVDVDARFLELKNDDPESEFQLSEGRQHYSDVYRGVVTAADGQRYEVTFETLILMPECSPFQLPRFDASGRFYLSKTVEADGTRALMHWEGRAGKKTEEK